MYNRMKKIISIVIAFSMIFSYSAVAFAVEGNGILEPVVAEVTAGTVTLQSVDGYEYSNGGDVWQESTYFDGLESGTIYLFYQRLVAVDGGEPGEMSEVLEVKTDKSEGIKPEAPVLQRKTHEIVYLASADGCEYSIDGVTWQKVCSFYNLQPETEYKFYQRAAETEKAYASEASEALIVKTDAASEGTETEDEPSEVVYTEVYTKEDLNNVRNNLNGNYILMNDISFEPSEFEEGGQFYNDGKGWEPIGKSRTESFNGIFDGNGHTISGIKINVEDEAGSFGLFGWNTGTISNLGVAGSSVKLENLNVKSSSSLINLGGIAGFNSGKISDCYFSGTVSLHVGGTSVYHNIGGICGNNGTGTIENCYNAGNIYAKAINSAKADCGGITGNGNGVKSCYNAGNVITNTGDLDGISTGTIPYGAKSYMICYDDSVKAKNSTDNVRCYLTEEEMQDEAYFDEFDFENRWVIDENSEYKYPQLKEVPMKCGLKDSEDFSGGCGTADDPYIITTAQQLDKVRNNLGANYKLANDIVFTEEDFADATWEPIGRDAYDKFYGIFDGNGYVISGIEVNVVSEDENDIAGGVFGYNGGVIKNLGTVGGSIKVHRKAMPDGGSDEVFPSYGEVYAGGIAGVNCATIVRCYNSNYVNGINSADSALKNCYVGGIAGYNSGIYLTANCFNTEHVQSIVSNHTIANAGGITGGVTGHKGAIVHCYNTGSAVRIGSLGYNLEYLTGDELKESKVFDDLDYDKVWSMGDESGYPYPVLKNVHFVEREENEDFAGGIGTEYDPYIIQTPEQLINISKYPNDHFVLENDIDMEGYDWTVAGDSQVNAFGGTFDGGGHTIMNLNVVGNKSRTEHYYGMFGYCAGTVKNLNLKNCSVNLQKGLKERIYAGNLIGYVDEAGTVQNCSIQSSEVSVVSNQNELYIGGIAGKNDGLISVVGYNGTIMTDCEIQAKGYIGSIIGGNTGTVERAGSSGNVICLLDDNVRKNVYIGGICGKNAAVIKDSFACGDVSVSMEGSDTGAFKADCVVGISENNGNVESSYFAGKIILGGKVKKKLPNLYYKDYDENASSILTEKQMLDEDNYIDFDFDTVWEMNTDVKNGYRYPLLRDVELAFSKNVISSENTVIDVEDAGCYTGKLIEPEITVTYKNELLVEGIDYEVSYSDNMDAGKAYYVITGKDDYTGTITGSFTIKPMSIADLKVEDVDASYEYTGNSIKPQFYFNGLEEGKDFTVTYFNNSYPGQAKIVIKGKGNYTGTVNETFNITYKKASSKVDAELSTSKNTSTGYDDIKVTWSKAAKADGYAVYMKKNNGNYVRKIYTTKTSYIVKNLSDGAKYTFKIVPYVKHGDEKYFSSKYKTDSVYTLKEVSEPKASRYSSTKVKLRWSDINGESGYQIRKMSLKNGKYTTVSTYTSSNPYKIIKATKGKTYYYKVRAYKVVDDKKVYGPWSDMKKYKLK